MNRGSTKPLLAAAALAILVSPAWGGAPAPETREAHLLRSCSGGSGPATPCVSDTECAPGTCEVEFLQGPNTSHQAVVTLLVDDEVGKFDDTEAFPDVVAVTALLEVDGPDGRRHLFGQTYQNLQGTTLAKLVSSLQAGPFIADTVLSGGGCGSATGGGTGTGGGSGGGGQLLGNRVTEPCLNDRAQGGKILRDLLLQQGDSTMAHAVRRLLGTEGPLVIVQTPGNVAGITYDNHRNDGLATVVRMNVTLQAVAAAAEETCGGGAGPCHVTVDSPPGHHGDLQTAIGTAHDGATITVTGICAGPVVIARRRKLVIEGVPPTSGGCPPDGLRSGDLVATVTGAAGDGEPIKIIQSSNITVRFLNVIDGEAQGVELEGTRETQLHCSCLARNRDGVEIEGGTDNHVGDNVVVGNAEDGIRLHRGAAGNTIAANRVKSNGDDGIELEDGANDNVVQNNTVGENGADGVDLDEVQGNHVTGNQVEHNGQDAGHDSGIELDRANGNVIDGNIIHENADGLTGEARCRSGTGNAGSNVGGRCR